MAHQRPRCRPAPPAPRTNSLPRARREPPGRKSIKSLLNQSRLATHGRPSCHIRKRRSDLHQARPAAAHCPKRPGVPQRSLQMDHAMAPGTLPENNRTPRQTVASCPCETHSFDNYFCWAFSCCARAARQAAQRRRAASMIRRRPSGLIRRLRGAAAAVSAAAAGAVAANATAPARPARPGGRPRRLYTR
jgi:hypothetical protein